MQLSEERNPWKYISKVLDLNLFDSKIHKNETLFHQHFDDMCIHIANIPTIL